MHNEKVSKGTAFSMQSENLQHACTTPCWVQWHSRLVMIDWVFCSEPPKIPKERSDLFLQEFAPNSASTTLVTHIVQHAETCTRGEQTSSLKIRENPLSLWVKDGGVPTTNFAIKMPLLPGWQWTSETWSCGWKMVGSPTQSLQSRKHCSQYGNLRNMADNASQLVDRGYPDVFLNIHEQHSIVRL